MNGNERMTLLEGVFMGYNGAPPNPIRYIKFKRVGVSMTGQIQRRRSVRSGEITFEIKLVEKFKDARIAEQRIDMIVRKYMYPEDASILYIGHKEEDHVPPARVLEQNEVGRYIAEICVSFMV